MLSVQRTEGRVSPSMVEGVFQELKDNGYSDGQVLALSRMLADLAARCNRRVSFARDEACESVGFSFAATDQREDTDDYELSPVSSSDAGCYQELFFAGIPV